MLTDLEPGIPGGWRAASGPPQSRTRRDVSKSGRTLGVLECGGESAAHGGEDTGRVMRSAELWPPTEARRADRAVDHGVSHGWGGEKSTQ